MAVPSKFPFGVLSADKGASGHVEGDLEVLTVRTEVFSRLNRAKDEKKAERIAYVFLKTMFLFGLLTWSTMSQCNLEIHS